MKNKQLFLIVFLFTLAGNLSAQSFFKAMPKYTHRVGITEGETAAAQPTTMNSFRPVVGVAAYSIPDNMLMTGAGISYQHLTYNNTTLKWSSAYSISLLLYAGTSLGATAGSDAVSPGLMFGVLNNLVLLGGTYVNGKFLVLTGIGINLNN